MRGKLDLSGLESHLGYWLRLVSNNVSGAFARALQTHQISVAEWVALQLIHQGRNVTLSHLAEAMVMTRGGISKILDKLEAKDLITREENPDDCRIQWLSLTRTGSKLLPKLADLADKNDAHFFNCLSQSEQSELLRLLQKLTESNGLHGTPLH